MNAQDQRPAPAPQPSRVPAWIKRRDEGLLKPKDMTGSVAL